ncbi:VWA domain-containing protein [Amycolatopsis tolypomycina]|uniref:VWA domain-containing protein n=1 Tax=Amycolatopsis tolypomycina TaxID=208445 RepID=UPI0033B30AC2
MEDPLIGRVGMEKKTRDAVTVLFCGLLLILSGGFADAASPASRQGSAAAPEVEVKPAQIVLLVDESGSISAEDMVREQDAASLIAQADLSARSTVSVVGFASDSGTKPPVDVVCPPLVMAGPAERERISQCVRDLRKRTTAEGTGTDHAEALKQAMSYLGNGSSDDGPKLIFLLTDGVLDVSDSPRYGVGKTAQQRNDAAHEVIRQNLAAAREHHVQIWPLGFGKVDKNALDEFARGGFQSSCGPQAPTPQATVVSGSADVAEALLRSFSSGRCAGVGPVAKNELGSGGNLEVPVTVPAIATDGSIVVVKHDGRVVVDYTDPEGKPVPKSGQNASGKFSVSGESGGVEVLHIVDPVPGDWRVRLTSPAGVPPQDVLTTVTWQGAAQAALLIDPPSPAVGQQVTVSLQVLLRGGKAVTDPKLLQGLSFGVQLAGDKLPARPVNVRDDGQDPDAAVDGTYTGRTTIPTDVPGQATFRGQVTGLGISAADAVATVRTAPGVPQVLATASLPTLATMIAPGGSTAAQVSVTNNSGQRRRLRVEVRADSGATITVPDPVHEVDPGTSVFPFQLVVGPQSPIGLTSGTVRIVDDANPSQVFHEKPFKFAVGYPPPFPWVPIIAGVVLLAGVAVIALAVSRRRTQEVKGLTVQAIRHGRRTYLDTESRRAKAFRFTVAIDAQVPVLDHARPGDPAAYLLTRSRAGLKIKTPYGETRSIQLGEEVEVDEGLTLVVTPTASGADTPTAVYPAGPATVAEDYPDPDATRPVAHDPLL